MTLDSPSGVKYFCSEVCFVQCRRASFKKTKICDWCKHVRHTVNYVEFKDGETELQFCSEKCLNQYKMSVFCKETQELSKKIANSENGGKTKDDDGGRNEILITPELWLGGERQRRAERSDRRDSTTGNERSDGREISGRFRHNSHVTGETLDLSTKKVETRSETGDSSRVLLLDRVKQETASKHKRTLSSKENDKLSQTRTECSSTSPSVIQNVQALPGHPLHPAVAAGMAPWVHHAQLMNAVPPGILPYPHMTPLVVPGMISPSAVGGAADTPKLTPVSIEVEHDKRTPKRELSVNSSSNPRTENTASTRHEKRSPSMLPDRRTSSLFPVDFPHFLQHAGVPNVSFQPPIPDSTAPRPSLYPGIPPVTVMLPFPVVLPLPVPIPIPIPLTMKQLTTLFGDKSESANSSNSVNTDPENSKEAKSPRPFSHSPGSVTSAGSDVSFDKQEVRAGSRNSCPDMTSHSYSNIRLSVSESQTFKRSRTPESLDLSRTSKIPRYEFDSFVTRSNIGAIDLSATRDSGHKSDDNCSESGIINGTGSDGNSSPNDSEEAVPKIHIITRKDETPLNAPLPLPPTEHPYSSRRGLILDAPAVAKKSRSPSPERRIYFRNVPRDIIEAARRRCNIKSRIRTK